MTTRFHKPVFADYRSAYQSGRVTPREVVDATLTALDRSDADDPALRSVVGRCDDQARAAARRSEQRWRRGEPLSVLDGVPVTVKDNIDMAGIATTNGTRIEFPVPSHDARVVAILRELGAVIVGKANMHEIGGGTSGINPSLGTARNPYDPGRWCGGSSSGSACGVGAGLVPLSIGTDAGGSIRAPASFCGAVGFKPTFGRISRLGMSIVCDTLDHIGPITQTCEDAAVAYALLAGVCVDDEETWDQQPVGDWEEVVRLLHEPIAGMRIGYARSLLSHPSVDPRVAGRVALAAEVLEEAGAALIDVTVPDLAECLDVFLVIVSAEGTSGREEILEGNLQLLGADIQVLLSLNEHVKARDYLRAQRLRKSIGGHWAELLDGVEAVLMPAAGIPAQVIRKDALSTGELDEETSTRAIACTCPANLTGFPAVTVPCGLVDDVPVAAQVVAAPWGDHRALQIGAVIEAGQLMPGRRPRRYFGDAILPPS